MTGQHFDDSSIFDRDLERRPANHVPLSPLGFLRRSATIYPGKTAVIHGDRRITYAELYERCRRLADALRAARASGAATRSRCWRRTCRRCWRRITACRWPAPC